MFANLNGKAGNENKYEIPPPKDNDLFFGSLVLVYHSDKNVKNGNTLDLTTDDWDKYYNKLYLFYFYERKLFYIRKIN